ncbi:unnamed protein product [Chrysodeixis includens]|uniref:Uncharacterized protein n=1 Tax=Chrysodeixis includens TaxID=689277 RepID=A0A9N8KYQ5_CHRIL|nr:unnamed protein product [Chrysodeixis includens]
MEQTKPEDKTSGDYVSGTASRRGKSGENVSRNEYYDMNNKHRGKALIFNHDEFESCLELKPRSGSRKDCASLQAVLQHLGFNVETFHNLYYSDIMKQMKHTAKQNHSKDDCIAVIVLSHGDSGVVYAKDTFYNLEKMWGHLSENNCPTLAGKPKLFFIQACQGEDFDDGITLSRHIETDGWYEPHMYSNEPNILVALATTPGYISWRRPTIGTPFIQALCKELYSASELDILSILTSVCHQVAVDYESDTSEPKKQVPCIMSTLTRRLVFTKKPDTMTSSLWPCI